MPQGWKGSVKARHLVLALHDYFIEKFQNKGGPEEDIYSASPVSSILSPLSSEALGVANLFAARQKRTDNQWALKYFSLARMQPILEAFDDDGTGFVSLREVNMFSTSRPRDWRSVALLPIF
jgi:hypothetical protein